MADLLVLSRPAELAKWRRLQRKNLSILGVCLDQRSGRIRAPGVASIVAGAKGEEDPNGQVVGIKRTVKEKAREAGRSLIERKKSTGKRTDPCEAPRWTRKERLL